MTNYYRKCGQGGILPTSSDNTVTAYWRLKGTTLIWDSSVPLFPGGSILLLMETGSSLSISRSYKSPQCKFEGRGNLKVNTKKEGWRLNRRKIMNNWHLSSGYSLITICASHVLAHFVYTASPWSVIAFSILWMNKLRHKEWRRMSEVPHQVCGEPRPWGSRVSTLNMMLSGLWWDQMTVPHDFHEDIS